MQDRYSIYQAKARLSEIIRRVKRNGTVVITERGKPVARVVPLPRDNGLDPRLQELHASGQIVGNPDADPGRIGPIAHRPGALRRFLESRNRF